jgi:hypothetical protein
MSRRCAKPFAIALIVVGLSAGCSQSASEGGDIHVGHEEAKAEIEEIYQRTVVIVGDGWNKPESSWGGCARSSRSDNTDSWSRVNQRFGDLNAPALTIAERVAEEWNRLGYSVKVETDDTLTPPRKVVSYPAYLTGTTPEGFGAVFTVGEGYADFRGYSRCVPSDPDLEGQVPS